MRRGASLPSGVGRWPDDKVSSRKRRNVHEILAKWAPGARRCIKRSGGRVGGENRSHNGNYANGIGGKSNYSGGFWAFIWNKTVRIMGRD
jgi:hypothetical protein